MRVLRDVSAGLLIDVQERLFPHMEGNEELLRRTTMLLEGLKILQVPLLVTEQYPRGLGPTLEPLSELVQDVQVQEKIAFSCCGDEGFKEQLTGLDRSLIIVCGIEAHVCVMQTVIDLIELGYRVAVVEDCISSRNMNDKNVAVERMRQEGAIVTTCESVLFELARVAGTDEFKAISKLVK